MVFNTRHVFSIRPTVSGVQSQTVRVCLHVGVDTARLATWAPAEQSSSLGTARMVVSIKVCWRQTSLFYFLERKYWVKICSSSGVHFKRWQTLPRGEEEPITDAPCSLSLPKGAYFSQIAVQLCQGSKVAGLAFWSRPGQSVSQQGLAVSLQNTPWPHQTFDAGYYV